MKQTTKQAVAMALLAVSLLFIVFALIEFAQAQGGGTPRTQAPIHTTRTPPTVTTATATVTATPGPTPKSTPTIHRKNNAKKKKPPIVGGGS